MSRYIDTEDLIRAIDKLQPKDYDAPFSRVERCFLSLIYWTIHTQPWVGSIPKVQEESGSAKEDAQYGKRGIMIDKIGEPAMLEQLAEECTELAQAALKKARKIRNENPTPKSMEEINANLIEETTDVIIALSELGLDGDPDIMRRKTARFIDRWNHRQSAENAEK